MKQTEERPAPSEARDSEDQADTGDGKAEMQSEGPYNRKDLGPSEWAGEQAG